MPDMKTVTIEFGTDPQTIGEDATRADLATWQENCAEAVAEKFGAAVHSAVGSGNESVRCDVPEIQAWLTAQMRGDGWLQWL